MSYFQKLDADAAIIDTDEVDTNAMVVAMNKLSSEQGELVFAIILDHYVRVDGNTVERFSMKGRDKLSLPYDGVTLYKSKSPFYNCSNMPHRLLKKLHVHANNIGVI